MTASQVVSAFGQDGVDAPKGLPRAALVATLVTDASHDDVGLVRLLLQEELVAVERAGDGCGDTLLACCWLLFVFGAVEDSSLVWRAKNVNFDAHCYIDSVFLIPQGAQSTVRFARAHGLQDLAAWCDEGAWLGDTEEQAQGWRSGEYFAGAPAPARPVAELAAWIRG